jgi:hypothetical protein
LEFIRAGASFLISGGRVGKPHLWLVLTDPEPPTGKVVIAMVVTSRPHTDKTVTLNPGDHQFIVRESNVAYGEAYFRTSDQLTSAIQAGRCELQPDMSDELLTRVREGLLESPFTIHAVADYCRERF